MLKPARANLTRMVDNVLSVYYGSGAEERDEGLRWYRDAHEIAQDLADRYDTEVVVTAAVLSILSPSNRWNTNLRDADAMLSAWRAGLPPESFTVSTYGQNKRKAWAMLHGEMTPEEAFNRRAQKTLNFWALIADPDGWPGVVVDGHAIGIALGERKPLDSVPRLGIKAYEALSDAYVVAAQTVGIKPHQMQAITWVAWRNTHLGGTRWATR